MIGWLVLTAFLALSVGFVLGAWWCSVFAANRIAVLEAEIADGDHARFVRDEAVRDAAEMALDGIDWP